MSTNRFSLLTATPIEWSTKNPILLKGELGSELGSGESRIKVGDGITRWNDLPYATDDVYPYSDTATVNIGDIKIGDALQGELTNDLLQKVLAPYVNPAFTSFKASNKTSFTYEIGTKLPTSFSLTWTISNLENVQDANTGIINSSDINAFTNLGNVNLKNLLYTLNSTSNYTYNLPKNISISITGNNTKLQKLTTQYINIDWKGLFIWGANSTGSVTSATNINSLKSQNSLLSNSIERTYNFGIGYPFVLAPDVAGIDLTGLTFTDAETGLAFSMALQNTWNSSLPNTISYNNGNTTFNYKIYRGEYYYNAPTKVTIAK